MLFGNWAIRGIKVVCRMKKKIQQKITETRRNGNRVKERKRNA